jgi:hypothetical protein
MFLLLQAYEHAVQVTRAEEEEKERLSKELQMLVSRPRPYLRTMS